MNQEAGHFAFLRLKKKRFQRFSERIVGVLRMGSGGEGEEGGVKRMGEARKERHDWVSNAGGRGFLFLFLFFFLPPCSP